MTSHQDTVGLADTAYNFLVGIARAAVTAHNLHQLDRVLTLAARLEPGHTIGCDGCNRVHHRDLLEEADPILPARQTAYDGCGDPDVEICAFCVAAW